VGEEFIAAEVEAAEGELAVTLLVGVARLDAGIDGGHVRSLKMR
jgi:hypothetical protein